jgi:hypothetical protein
MSNLKLSLFSLAILGVSIALILCLRSLNKLQAENANLVQANNQLTQLAAENERLSNSLAEAKSTASDNQQRELLRLRSEVAGLRKQTNDLAKLREDNRRLRESQAQALKQKTDEPEPPADPWRQAAMAKMSDSRQIVLAMILNADTNGGLISTNINDLTNHLLGADSTFTGTNDFELLYNGKLNLLKDPSATIIVRERNATLHPDGNRVKAYGFADGHSEYHKAEPDGNFDRWEQQHLPPVSPNP